jgi:septal ring factor EnvC (AmiA/AmiB activator)
MVKFIKNIFLFLFVAAFLVAQTNESIKKKNAELEKIKSEITRLEKELASKKNVETDNIQLLDKINHQSHLLNEAIKRIVEEEKALEKKIKKLNLQITELQKEITELQKEYASYVQWLYKNGQESKWSLLLKADSFNQAVVRYKYFNYITDKNEARVTRLREQKEKLERLTSDLRLQIKEKKKLETEKEKESEKLKLRREEKNKLLAELVKDRKNIEKEIDEKRKYEIEIKSIIVNLIEKERERERKLREAKFKNNSVQPYIPKINYTKFQNFAELKGKLNWPVLKGKIVRKFGENKNKKLKTITLNYGVDIKTVSEGKVFAVAEGVVSIIDWIPGFGSIIIVTHKGNFRTVYGHIDNIEVNEGDVIKAGTVLGTVNKSLEGNLVHFEIWDERNYKNPEKWLAKKSK